MEAFMSSGGTLPEVEGEKSVGLQKAERQEDNSEKLLADLRAHPGWEVLRSIMVADILSLEGHAEINFVQLDDAELGRAVRTDVMLAEKLRAYVTKVETANLIEESEEGEADEGGD